MKISTCELAFFWCHSHTLLLCSALCHCSRMKYTYVFYTVISAKIPGRWCIISKPLAFLYQGVKRSFPDCGWVLAWGWKWLHRGCWRSSRAGECVCCYSSWRHPTVQSEHRAGNMAGKTQLYWGNLEERVTFKISLVASCTLIAYWTVASFHSLGRQTFLW